MRDHLKVETSLNLSISVESPSEMVWDPPLRWLDSREMPYEMVGDPPSEMVGFVLATLESPSEVVGSAREMVGFSGEMVRFAYEIAESLREMVGSA